MSTYRIELRTSAARSLSRLPKQTQQRIAVAIDALAQEPRPNGCKKLKGHAETWRVRVGDYRVLYTVQDDVLCVEVIRIAQRKDVYE